MKKEEKNQSKFFKSRIKTYSTLAVSAIALDVSAQVGYTDIPDTTLTNNGDFFDIDLNNDGIADVKITRGNLSFNSGSVYISGSYASVRGQNGGFINKFSSYASTSFVVAFSSNQSINSNVNSWTQYTSQSYGGLLGGKFYSSVGSSYNTFSLGNFLNQTDKYLGVRFPISGSIGFHYGWVRLDVNAGATSVTIKDFAYDSTANASILAGDRGALVGLEITPFQKTDFFYSHRQLNFKGSIPAKTQLTIIDLKGQKVQEVNLLENQRSQALTNFSNGIYIVEIRDGKSVLRKKMWLEAN